MLIGSALFNPLWSCGSLPIVSARTDSLDRPTTERRTLTLIVLPDARFPRATAKLRAQMTIRRETRVCVCACTHYLVFKEPTARAPGAPDRRGFWVIRDSLPVPPLKSRLRGRRSPVGDDRV